MSYVLGTYIVVIGINILLDVVIEHGTESKSNTNSPLESMVDSSNSNTTVTIEQTQPQNMENEEPVVKRELLLLLPDRTLDPSPRIVSASK